MCSLYGQCSIDLLAEILDQARHVVALAVIIQKVVFKRLRDAPVMTTRPPT